MNRPRFTHEHAIGRLRPWPCRLRCARHCRRWVATRLAHCGPCGRAAATIRATLANMREGVA